MTYSQYLRSSHWKITRELKVEKKGGVCWICGATKNINVHHKRYSDKLGRSILGKEKSWDLILLCSTCHGYWHKYCHLVMKKGKQKFYTRVRRMVAIGMKRRAAFEMLPFWLSVKPIVLQKEREKRLAGAAPAHAQIAL